MCTLVTNAMFYSITTSQFKSQEIYRIENTIDLSQ